MSNAAAETQIAHTPGPWEFGRTGSEQIMVIGANDGPYVCHVQIQQAGGGAISAIMEPERRANARLIAAAPDMLDLARNVGGFDDRLLVSSDLRLLRATLIEFRDQARAALARAGAQS